MKQYKSIVVDAFHSDVTLDRRLKEMTDQGYTLLPVTFRGNVMIFERDVIIETAYQPLDSDIQTEVNKQFMSILEK